MRWSLSESHGVGNGLEKQEQRVALQADCLSRAPNQRFGILTTLSRRSGQPDGWSGLGEGSLQTVQHPEGPSGLQVSRLSKEVTGA